MSNIKLIASKKNNKAIHVLDLEAGQYKYALLDDIKRLNNKDWVGDRLILDKLPINETYGTLAFKDKQNKVYGILKEYGKSLSVCLIPASRLDNKDKSLSGVNSELLEIDSSDEQIYTKKYWISKYNCIKALICTDNIHSLSKISVEQLKSIIEDKPSVHEETLETQQSVQEETQESLETSETQETVEEITESTVIEKEETKEIIEDKEELFKGTSNNSNEMLLEFEKSLEKRLENIIEREKVIKEKEKELIEKSSRLNKVLARAESGEVNNIVNTLLEVDNVYVDGVEHKRVNLKQDYVYEMLLKTVSIGDMITISKDYFTRLKVYMRKNLESNISYTKYKAISTIKFHSEVKENIVALVNYDESLDGIQLTILKDYDDTEFTEDDLARYILQYNKWRKNVAMLN